MTEPAIDTGMILEALNDKTDRDCRNVDTTSGADVVIEYQIPTAENNYTWYRLYKSGWIEQGGVVVPLNSTKTINFIKNFANTNYMLSCGFIREDAIQTSFAYSLNFSAKTVSSVQAAGCFSGSQSSGIVGGDDEKFYWEAKGMAAQS